MKQRLPLLCFLVAINYSALSAKDDCCCKVSSHTTFVVMPQYQTATPERVTGFRNRIGVRADGVGGALEVVPLGGASLRSSNMAQFFTPFCKNLLSVSNNFKRDKPDLLAQHFNIYPGNLGNGNFKSVLCLEVSQAVAGIGLTYRQAFWQLPDSDNMIWFEISGPLLHVRNKVCLNETVSPDSSEQMGNGFPQNMVEAFKQKDWCYGKIDNCKDMHKTRLANLEFKCGYQWLKNDCCFFESFAGIIAPTGNKPTAHYMFEPIVGYGHHWAGEIGMTGVFQFWQSRNYDLALSFVLDLNAWYLAQHTERRSFDLKERPWSRYMQVYANKEQAQLAHDLTGVDQRAALVLATPGINVFTKDMCVSPRMAKIINSGLVFTGRHIEAEIGYNFFTRQAECVKLASYWKEGPALKAVNQGGGFTNNLQSINRYTISEEQYDRQPLPVESYDLNLIKECDIDFESAAHPGFITNTVYGSFMWRWDELKFPCFVGLGGSFEYCDDNAYFSRWLCWAKAGISF